MIAPVSHLSLRRPSLDWRWLLAIASGCGVPVPAVAQQQASGPPSSTQTPPPQAAAPGATTVTGVVVTASRPSVTTSIDRKSYSLGRDLQAQGGSLADALRNIPSVQVDPLGNVSVRGDPNVTILIDGKPAAQFEGDSRGQALQAFPADRVERIEVATNPSASLTANGSGGVINLITKKAKGVGPTGSIRAGLGTAERDSISASGGYNGEKVSATVDAFYRRMTQRQGIDDSRAEIDAGSAASFSQLHSIQHATVGTEGVSGNVDYDLSHSLRLSAGTSLQYQSVTLVNVGDFELENAQEAPIESFGRRLEATQKRSDADLNAGLRYAFDDKGQELNLNLSSHIAQERRGRNGATEMLLPLQPDSFDQQRVDNSLHQLTFKGDYVRPASSGAMFKAGFLLRSDDNAYNDRGFAGSTPQSLAPNPVLTDLFKFRRQLTEAYATYEQPVSKLTILAGVRVEEARIRLDQATLGNSSQREFLGLYPSLHLSWKLSETEDLTASYSRRLQLPEPQQYNPFRFVYDPVSVQSGNPDLKPQQTNSIELGYQYQKRPATYFVTLYFRQDRGAVADVVRDLGDGVLLTTPENVSSSRTSGLELAADDKLSKDLSYQLSANAYWTQLDARGLGLAGSRSAAGLSGKATLDWRVARSDLIQVSGNLNGKRLTPQGYIQPYATLDIGYRHELKPNFAVLFLAQDLFASFRDRKVIDTPVLRAQLNRAVDARTFYLRLVWTFGGKPKDAASDFYREPGTTP